MSEKTRQRIVYAALAVAIVWGYYNLAPQSVEPEISRQETIQPLAPERATVAPAQTIDTVALANAPFGRDPFSTKAKRKQSKAVIWSVRGIVYNPASPLAYINGQRVGVGDKVNGATVVAIDKRKVTLEYHRKQFDVFVQKG
jgi:hypothetical protein